MNSNASLSVSINKVVLSTNNIADSNEHMTMSTLDFC
jgi:hypothetical protein